MLGDKDTLNVKVTNFPLGMVETLSAGNAVACALSLYLNHDFWWAILHTGLGWFYVVYALLGGQVVMLAPH